MARLDATKEHWMKMNIRGVDGYFSDYRIDRNTVPSYFKFWELADGDCDGEPCRYRPGILVNFYGTFITTKDLPIDDIESCTGYINGEEEWYFDDLSYMDFSEVKELESHSPMYIIDRNDKVWYFIPGFNGYQINSEGIVRSMKMMHKDPGHKLVKDKSGKYILTNDNNKRVRISPEELMDMTFNSNKELNPVMDDVVYLGGRNKAFTNNPNKKKDNKTYKIDLSSKINN